MTGAYRRALNLGRRASSDLPQHVLTDLHNYGKLVKLSLKLFDNLLLMLRYTLFSDGTDV